MRSVAKPGDFRKIFQQIAENDKTIQQKIRRKDQTLDYLKLISSENERQRAHGRFNREMMQSSEDKDRGWRKLNYEAQVKDPRDHAYRSRALSLQEDKFDQALRAYEEAPERAYEVTRQSQLGSQSVWGPRGKGGSRGGPGNAKLDVSHGLRPGDIEGFMERAAGYGMPYSLMPKLRKVQTGFTADGKPKFGMSIDPSSASPEFLDAYNQFNKTGRFPADVLRMKYGALGPLPEDGDSQEGGVQAPGFGFGQMLGAMVSRADKPGGVRTPLPKAHAGQDEPWYQSLGRIMANAIYEAGGTHGESVGHALKEGIGLAGQVMDAADRRGGTMNDYWEELNRVAGDLMFFQDPETGENVMTRVNERGETEIAGSGVLSAPFQFAYEAIPGSVIEVAKIATQALGGGGDVAENIANATQDDPRVGLWVKKLQESPWDSLSASEKLLRVVADLHDVATPQNPLVRVPTFAEKVSQGASPLGVYRDVQAWRNKLGATDSESAAPQPPPPAGGPPEVAPLAKGFGPASPVEGPYRSRSGGAPTALSPEEFRELARGEQLGPEIGDTRQQERAQRLAMEAEDARLAGALTPVAGSGVAGRIRAANQQAQPQVLPSVPNRAPEPSGKFSDQYRTPQPEGRPPHLDRDIAPALSAAQEAGQIRPDATAADVQRLAETHPEFSAHDAANQGTSQAMNAVSFAAKNPEDLGLVMDSFAPRTTFARGLVQPGGDVIDPRPSARDVAMEEAGPQRGVMPGNDDFFYQKTGDKTRQYPPLKEPMPAIEERGASMGYGPDDVFDSRLPDDEARGHYVRRSRVGPVEGERQNVKGGADLRSVETAAVTPKELEAAKKEAFERGKAYAKASEADESAFGTIAEGREWPTMGKSKMTWRDLGARDLAPKPSTSARQGAPRDPTPVERGLTEAERLEAEAERIRESRHQQDPRTIPELKDELDSLDDSHLERILDRDPRVGARDVAEKELVSRGVLEPKKKPTAKKKPRKRPKTPGDEAREAEKAASLKPGIKVRKKGSKLEPRVPPKKGSGGAAPLAQSPTEGASDSYRPTESKYLLSVSAPKLKGLGGGVVVSDGKVSSAPPLLKKFVGQPVENLERWIKSNGGTSKRMPELEARADVEPKSPVAMAVARKVGLDKVDPDLVKALNTPALSIFRPVTSYLQDVLPEKFQAPLQDLISKANTVTKKSGDLLIAAQDFLRDDRKRDIFREFLPRVSDEALRWEAEAKGDPRYSKGLINPQGQKYRALTPAGQAYIRKRVGEFIRGSSEEHQRLWSEWRKWSDLLLETANKYRKGKGLPPIKRREWYFPYRPKLVEGWLHKDVIPWAIEKNLHSKQQLGGYPREMDPAKLIPSLVTNMLRRESGLVADIQSAREKILALPEFDDTKNPQLRATRDYLESHFDKMQGIHEGAYVDPVANLMSRVTLGVEKLIPSHREAAQAFEVLRDHILPTQKKDFREAKAAAEKLHRAFEKLKPSDRNYQSRRKKLIKAIEQADARAGAKMRAYYESQGKAADLAEELPIMRHLYNTFGDNPLNSIADTLLTHRVWGALAFRVGRYTAAQHADFWGGMPFHLVAKPEDVPKLKKIMTEAYGKSVKHSIAEAGSDVMRSIPEAIGGKAMPRDQLYALIRKSADHIRKGLKGEGSVSKMPDVWDEISPGLMKKFDYTGQASLDYQQRHIAKKFMGAYKTTTGKLAQFALAPFERGDDTLAYAASKTADIWFQDALKRHLDAKRDMPSDPRLISDDLGPLLAGRKGFKATIDRLVGQKKYVEARNRYAAWLAEETIVGSHIMARTPLYNKFFAAQNGVLRILGGQFMLFKNHPLARANQWIDVAGLRGEDIESYPKHLRKIVKGPVVGGTVGIASAALAGIVLSAALGQTFGYEEDPVEVAKKMAGWSAFGSVADLPHAQAVELLTGDSKYSTNPFHRPKKGGFTKAEKTLLGPISPILDTAQGKRHVARIVPNYNRKK